MGLFSIFKRKPEPEVIIVTTDGVKALTDGILFEEENVFLKWGADIEADKLYAKKGYRADRTIYEWGDKTILNGLKLPLKTICWNHKQHDNAKAFESIDFLEEGEAAEGYFQSIKKHIEDNFGEGKLSDDVHDDDIVLEWKIKAIKITLSLLNKERPKVHLEIGWWL